MTLLTADDVLNKKFQATKFREGYEQDEVDEFLDEVVEAMRQLEAENADLKAKLEAANRRVAELGDTAARGISETTVVEPVVQEPQPPVAPVAPVMTPPAMFQGAGPGGGEEPSAASGMLELAQRLHDEHVANGRAEGERIIGEARATGEQIVREAEDQRNRTLAQLEKERSGLEHKIDELRRFEADYRTRLKSYLHNLLNTVEDASESQAPAL